jgi:molybdopterin converting factor small subunit
LALSEPATIADVRSALAEECPALQPLLKHFLFAVDAEFATDLTPISSSSEIACIPPVSGG